MAGIWCRIWAALEGTSWCTAAGDSAQIRILKTLAHATWQDVVDGRTTEFERIGNGIADNLAKMGARAHRISQQLRDLGALVDTRVRELALWIGKSNAILDKLDRHQEDGRMAHIRMRIRDSKRFAPKPALPWRTSDLGGHCWDWANGSWVCIACNATSGQSTIGRRRRERCTSSFFARVSTPSRVFPLQGGVMHTHAFVRSSFVIWCARCGAYAGSKPRLLLRACRGRPICPSMIRRMGKLRLGLHPVSGAHLAYEAVPIDLSQVPLLSVFKAATDDEEEQDNVAGASGEGRPEPHSEVDLEVRWARGRQLLDTVGLRCEDHDYVRLRSERDTAPLRRTMTRLRHKTEDLLRVSPH